MLLEKGFLRSGWTSIASWSVSGSRSQFAQCDIDEGGGGPGGSCLFFIAGGDGKRNGYR